MIVAFPGVGVVVVCGVLVLVGIHRPSPRCVSGLGDDFNQPISILATHDPWGMFSFTGTYLYYLLPYY